MIKKFLEYITIERHYSPLTAQAYERDLIEFCSFLHVEPAELDPKLLTEADVKSWMVEMLDHGQTARTVRRKLSSVRSFWKFMLRIGWVDKDITRAIIAPKMDKPLPVFFRESDMRSEQALMEHADDFTSVRDSMIIEILYETGMRRAELLALTDGSFDLAQGQVRVFGKRSKERIIPFGSNLASWITRYWSYRNELFTISPSPSQPFLLSDKGLPMSRDTIYRIVRARMREVSSQKKISPHVLRHTFATVMLNNGADINTIKSLMGHSSLAATQVYTHATFEQLKKAYSEAHPRAKTKKNE